MKTSEVLVKALELLDGGKGWNNYTLHTRRVARTARSEPSRRPLDEVNKMFCRAIEKALTDEVAKETPAHEN